MAKWKVELKTNAGFPLTGVVEASSREAAIKQVAANAASRMPDGEMSESDFKVVNVSMRDSVTKDQLEACKDAVAKLNKRVDAAYGQGSEKGPVVVKGVKGAKSTPFTKKFPSMEAYSKWSDKEEATDYEVYTVEKG